MKKSKAVKSKKNSRAIQVASAQNGYRIRMRDQGFHRIQEWIPNETFRLLQSICETYGLTQREVLVRSLAFSKNSHQIHGEADDNRH